MTQVHVTEHLNYVCDRVCLWKFESMSKISYIIHVFCQLVFPGRKVKRIPTLDSGGVGGWGCLGSYTMNLEERKTKYGHTGLISKRGKQKTRFHVWVHYCQTVCPPVPSVVTRLARGEEKREDDAMALGKCPITTTMHHPNRWFNGNISFYPDSYNNLLLCRRNGKGHW